MEKYIFMLLGTILGVAISLYVYAIKKERVIKKIKIDQEYYSTQKLDLALDKAVKDMQLEMKAERRS